MSPDPHPAPAATAGAPPRERLGGVLGIGVGLLAILGLFASLASKRARSLDAVELYASWFEPVELPFGLAPVEAAEQPGGERMLRLANLDAPREAQAAEPQEESPRSLVPPEPVDWSRIPVGQRDTPPTDALLIAWPLRGAKQRREALFGAGPTRSEEGRGMGLPPILGGQDPLADLGPGGGRRVLERGRLAWGRLEAPYALERSFEAGGTFVDSLRVNLSGEYQALALFLRWPRGMPGSKSRAEEFLSQLRRKGEPPS